MTRSRSRSAVPLAAGAVAVAVGLTVLGAVPAQAATPTTAGCVATDARAAADAYLAALTSHDASAVPFAPDVLRIEDGLVTGRSADEIRHDLDTSVKYRIIVGLRNRTYTQDPQAADGTVTEHVDYLLDVGAPPTTLLSVHVQESFQVRCGQITKIVAIIGL